MWIDVRQRVPDLEQLVIILMDRSMAVKNAPSPPCVGLGYLTSFGNGETHWCANYNKNNFYYGVVFDNATQTWGKVTHWMPLPPLPNVESLAAT